MELLDGFYEPKPMMFPPFLDGRPKKEWEAAQDFGDVLSDKLDAQEVDERVAQIEAFEEPDPELIENENLSEEVQKRKKEKEQLAQVKANIEATRQLAFFSKGLDFLPREVLADIEFTGGRDNFERVEDDGYVDFRDALRTPFWNDEEDVRSSIFSDSFLDKVSEFPGQANTLPHNLNIFHGFSSWNPFKQEAGSHQTFESNPYYAPLSQGFVTPRHVLGDAFWERMNNIAVGLQESRFRQQNAAGISIANPFSNQDDGDLNWEGAVDPFTDNEIEEFDINANFHTLVASGPGVWQNWTSEQVFFFVNMAWESQSRSDAFNRQLLGLANEITPTVIDRTAEAAEGDESVEVPEQELSSLDEIVADHEARLTEAEAQLAQGLINDAEFASIVDEVNTERATEGIVAESQTEDKVLENIQDWWDRIGSNLDNLGMLLPYGLFASSAPTIQGMASWLEWENENEFQSKMIDGYVNYLAKEYLFKDFKGRVGLTADDLPTGAFDALVDAGFLTSSGALTDQFDATDPSLELNLGFSPTLEDRVREKLRETALGALDLDTLDISTINGQSRSNIKLNTPDGREWRMSQLMDLISSGSSTLEKYVNIRDAYNVVFDIAEGVMGIGLGKEFSDGKPQLTRVENGFEMNIYPNADWQQWNAQSESWETIEGQPLSIVVESEAKAEQFLSEIRKLIAVIEPLVASFRSLDESGPGTSALSWEGGDLAQTDLRVLVDNQGAAGDVNFIGPGSSNYELGVDTVFSGQFFESRTWKNGSEFLHNKVLFELGRSIFQTSQVNRMMRADHKKKVEEYKRKEDEHKEKKREEKIDEKKRELRKRAKFKKAENEIAAMQKKLKKALEAEDKKRRAKAAAERKRAQKKG